jgi:hypothetical protein
MIAIAKRSSHTKRCSDWHTAFLALLPAIAHYASRAFRNLPAEARKDAIQETIASCQEAWTLEGREDSLVMRPGNS